MYLLPYCAFFIAYPSCRCYSNTAFFLWYAFCLLRVDNYYVLACRLRPFFCCYLCLSSAIGTFLPSAWWDVLYLRTTFSLQRILPLLAGDFGVTCGEALPVVSAIWDAVRKATARAERAGRQARLLRPGWVLCHFWLSAAFGDRYRRPFTDRHRRLMRAAISTLVVRWRWFRLARWAGACMKRAATTTAGDIARSLRLRWRMELLTQRRSAAARLMPKLISRCFYEERGRITPLLQHAATGSASLPLVEDVLNV